jgi:5-hydroxytryptamine receptor 7
MSALNISGSISYDPINTNISNITFISDYETTSEAWSNVSESNSTFDGIPESPYTEWQMGLVTFILLVLIIGTIIGNSLVCIAVGMVKKLQTPSNLLILSLAVSDLLVAVLVMPFVTTYEVMGYWALGDVVCNLFTSLDVILCTAVYNFRLTTVIPIVSQYCYKCCYSDTGTF